jgi:hypothetical protein
LIPRLEDFAAQLRHDLDRLFRHRDEPPLAMKRPPLTGIAEPPNPDLIDWLEDALESAKSGDLRHMAAVGIWRGREASVGWTPDINSSLITVLGGMRRLEHELLRKCEDQNATLCPK